MLHDLGQLHVLSVSGSTEIEGKSAAYCTHQQLNHLHCISNSVNSSAEMWILFIVHRAPVLVALALIESGMKYEDAVEFIRRYVKSEY